MPRYAYQAVDNAGRRVSGVLEAPSEQEADQALLRQGLYVVSVSQRADRPAPRISSLRIGRRDLITFTVHLATVLSSGIPLLSGLRDFAEEARNARLKRVADSVRQSVEAGASLSEAMARLPGVFPELYVSMVEAGEKSGRVDTVLFDLVGLLEWQASLASQIRTASAYPIMLLSAITVLLIVMTVFVFPRFIQAMIKAGAPLPLPTQIMLGIGTIITEYWSLLILGGVATHFAFRSVVSTPAGRYALDRIKLGVPVVGEMIRRVAVNRFARAMEATQRSGVEFALSMGVAERVVGNAVIARAVREAREKVLAGTSLAAALRATGEFPPLVLQMVATGESSGTLAETLNRVTQYYDREVPASVRRLFTVVESLVYIVLGAVVLGTALAFYSPIYSMLRHLRVTPRF